MNKSKEATFWNNFASTYEAHYHLDKKYAQSRLHRKVNLLIESSGISTGKHVLEVGFGTGVFTEQLDKTDARICAIDISTEMLKIAMQKKTVNTSFMVRDAEDTGLPNEYFDIIVGTYILQWVQMDNLFREAHRLLKPRGKLSIIAKNGLNPLTFVGQLKYTVKYIMNDSIFSDIIIPKNIIQRLTRHGFINVKIVPFEFGCWIPLGRLLENTPVIKNIAGSLLISADKE